LKVISIVSEEVYQEMKKIESRIIKSRDNVEALERRLEDLDNLNTNIQNSLNEIESKNMSSSDKLLLIHELAHELVIVFSKIIPDIERVEKRMKHFFYLKDILITNRRQMEKDVNALGHRKTQIEEMLETKQDRSEYITWVNKLVRDYNALKSSSKVSKMRYTYNRPNGGHYDMGRDYYSPVSYHDYTEKYLNSLKTGELLVDMDSHDLYVTEEGYNIPMPTTSALKERIINYLENTIEGI